MLRKKLTFHLANPPPTAYLVSCPDDIQWAGHRMETGTVTKISIQPDLLKNRQHYQVLDGLRGVAALVVVIFHFLECVYSDYSKNFAGHGFLAVDFFFCLSGFVIAYAYDGRIDKMGLKEFFKSRLIRLHPLVILGSVMGLLAFLFDPFATLPNTYSFMQLAILFLCSILLIPYPVMTERTFNLFGFNAPAWSLFWEYVANICYALVLRKAHRGILVALMIAAALALGYAGHSAGNLMGGWGKDNFWHGGARVAYSFLAGMLVFRFNLIIKNKLGFAGLSVLLLLSLLMPYFTHNWMVELAVVLVYFPLLIALGAGAVANNGWKKICVFSGNISYPLYMTHYAAIWMFANYYTAHKPDTLTLMFIVTGATMALIGIAYAAMKLYDIPVRKYLSSKRKMS
ncbi:acyltransferase family protein [Chitinophaga polysaccharea]|uniref:acyltransferase family protein n=1 Tax=Chitinophaga polysaccharea TaxID=1293035 RepID=UPI001FFDEC03|nr:acyltransferase [Chitinophaga polysaccharea]